MMEYVVAHPCLVLMLMREDRLDLLVLGKDPWIGLVPLCVELREDLEAFLRLVMVNKPTGGLWLRVSAELHGV